LFEKDGVQKDPLYVYHNVDKHGTDDQKKAAAEQHDAQFTPQWKVLSKQRDFFYGPKRHDRRGRFVYAASPYGRSSSVNPPFFFRFLIFFSLGCVQFTVRKFVSDMLDPQQLASRAQAQDETWIQYVAHNFYFFFNDNIEMM
jgi:hypothetical protein